MKYKRWKIISVVVFFILLGVVMAFANYFNKNPMYVAVWFNRMMGGHSFYLEGVRMNVPESCMVDDGYEHKLALVDFLCAVEPARYEGASISRPSYDNVEKTKSLTERYTDYSDHVHMVIGPKQGHEAFNAYYLKKQNVVVISDTESIGELFVEELLKHDFRIESLVPASP